MQDGSSGIQSNSPIHSVAAGRDLGNYTVKVHAFEVGCAPPAGKYGTFARVDDSIGFFPGSGESSSNLNTGRGAPQKVQFRGAISSIKQFSHIRPGYHARGNQGPPGSKADSHPR